MGPSTMRVIVIVQTYDFSSTYSIILCLFSEIQQLFCLLLICLAILALIDDDLVVQVDLLHRFMGYRKLLVAKIIHLSSAPNIVEIVKSVVSLAKQLVFSLAKAQSVQ